MADLLSHIVPVLCGVYAGLQGRSPAGRVHGGAFMFGTLEGLPVNQESDGVLGLGHTVVGLACGNTRRGAGNNTSGHSNILQNPAADVDVMRREIVARR